MIDRPAVLRGAIVALVVTVPFGFVEGAVSSQSKGLVFLIILIGFGLGGAVAGRPSPTRWLTHGALAGLVAGAVYLAIGIVAHAATGDTTRPGALVFTGLLAMCCGALGAEVGHRWDARRAATREDGQP